MKIKMSIQQRATMRLALMAHLKLIEAAKKAVAKALIGSMEIPVAEARVDEALKLMPSSQATSELWEVPDVIRGEYRDALYLLGQAVLKVREKEVQQGIDTASSDARLEEIRTLLGDLGDQRDLFAPDSDEDDDQIDIEDGGE